MRPVSVEIPVGVPCKVEAIEKPDFALRHVSARDDLAEKVRAALVEIHQRRAYEAEIEAALEACR